MTCRSVRWKTVTNVSFLRWEKDRTFICGRFHILFPLHLKFILVSIILQMQDTPEPVLFVVIEGFLVRHMGHLPSFWLKMVSATRGHSWCYGIFIILSFYSNSLNLINYHKNPQINHTFFPKIITRNLGCGLSAGTFPFSCPI